MTELVLLRGVYGSNKGWIARGLVRSRGELDERWTHIDVRPQPVAGAEGKRAARASAYMLAEHKMQQALLDDVSVVLTGVFVKASDVARMLETARRAGATRCRIVFCPQVRDQCSKSRHLLRIFEHIRYEETYHEGIFDR